MHAEESSGKGNRSSLGDSEGSFGKNENPKKEVGANGGK